MNKLTKFFSESKWGLVISESVIMIVSIFIMFFRKELTFLNYFLWGLASSVILIMLSFLIWMFLSGDEE